MPQPCEVPTVFSSFLIPSQVGLAQFFIIFIDYVSKDKKIRWAKKTEKLIKR
jgi:hypothetical protein